MHSRSGMAPQQVTPLGTSDVNKLDGVILHASAQEPGRAGGVA